MHVETFFKFERYKYIGYLNNFTYITQAVKLTDCCAEYLFAMLMISGLRTKLNTVFKTEEKTIMIGDYGHPTFQSLF